MLIHSLLTLFLVILNVYFNNNILIVFVKTTILLIHCIVCGKKNTNIFVHYCAKSCTLIYDLFFYLENYTDQDLKNKFLLVTTVFHDNKFSF